MNWFIHGFFLSIQIDVNENKGGGGVVGGVVTGRAISLFVLLCDLDSADITCSFNAYLLCVTVCLCTYRMHDEFASDVMAFWIVFP